MWNSRTLEAPPVNTFKAKSPLIDISAVASILKNAIKILNSQSTLELELKLLARCVYRFKLQLRNDKGYKLMEKITKVLTTLIRFNIANDLKEFLKALPKKYEKHFYLPTKQMLEYVLVRLQGFAKLCCRVVECSINVAAFMKLRLQIGHIWKSFACFLAFISRIWYITKIFTEKCCSWFNTLLPLRDKFEINGVKWLPDDYSFPNDLEKWLDVTWLHYTPDVADPVHFELPIFSLLDDSDDEVEFCHQLQMNDCYIIDDDVIIDVDKVQSSGKKRDIKGNNKEATSLIFIDDDDDENDDSQDVGESSKGIINIDESSKSLIEIDTDVDESFEDNMNKSIVNPIMNSNEDIGEVISRKSTTGKQVKRKPKRKTKKLKLQTLDPAVEFPWQTLKGMHKFLISENVKRKNNLAKCFTKAISDDSWVILSKKMRKFELNASLNKRKAALLNAKIMLQNALNEAQ